MLQHDYRQDQDEQERREEDEMETVYLYVYKDDPEMRPWSNWTWPNWRQWDTSHFVHVLVQVLALGMLSAFIFLPYMPAYTVKSITVPALFLKPHVLTVSVPIHATGRKTIPATRARGMLTVYNGSFLNQSLPAGFIVSTPHGIEFSTDTAVIVPPGNPPSYGIATVQAHALLAGSQGNIQAGAINAVYGSSLYIKNLTAFAGGKDAQTEHYVTDGDKAKALEAARQQLQEKQAHEQPSGILQKPCSESATQHETTLLVSWLCQYITYRAPANVQVLYVRIQGNTVILTVKTVVLPS
jgi:hypothetical protein